MPAVYQDPFGRSRKVIQRAQHGVMRRTMDSKSVNLLFPNRAQPHRGAGEDSSEGLLTGGRGKTLGVVNGHVGGRAMKDDGGGYDRTGQRTPADLIQAGQKARFKPKSAPEPLVELKEPLEPEIPPQNAPRCGRIYRLFCADSRALPV